MEQKILRILEKDGKATVKEIATELGVNEKEVENIINIIKAKNIKAIIIRNINKIFIKHPKNSNSHQKQQFCHSLYQQHIILRYPLHKLRLVNQKTLANPYFQKN